MRPKSICTYNAAYVHKMSWTTPPGMIFKWTRNLVSFKLIVNFRGMAWKINLFEWPKFWRFFFWIKKTVLDNSILSYKSTNGHDMWYIVSNMMSTSISSRDRHNLRYTKSCIFIFGLVLCNPWHPSPPEFKRYNVWIIEWNRNDDEGVYRSETCLDTVLKIKKIKTKSIGYIRSLNHRLITPSGKKITPKHSK